MANKAKGTREEGRPDISTALTSMMLPLDSILVGDCLTVLGELPENSIDLIFADPPYNLQLERDLYRPNRTKVDAVTDSWDKFGSFEEYDSFTRSWLSACKRVLKPRGSIWTIGTYHSIHRVGSIMQDLGFWILNEVVWIKSNPMPNFRGVRFTNAHETLIWARASKRSGTRFNHHDMKALNGDLQMRSDWILPVVSGRERLQWNGAKAHSAQKPESLLYRVILSSSQVNDVVLDPFFGTGTSGVVAKRLGRHYIGIELNPKYARLAASRLQKTLAHQLDVVEGLRQKEQRVPFGTLVERGLLRPGDRLYWEDGTRTATILANGHIRFGRVVGSIHKVASAISGAPSNGWTAWSFRNTNGRLQKIDALRKRVLRKT